VTAAGSTLQHGTAWQNHSCHIPESQLLHTVDHMHCQNTNTATAAAAAPLPPPSPAQHSQGQSTGTTVTANQLSTAPPDCRAHPNSLTQPTQTTPTRQCVAHPITTNHPHQKTCCTPEPSAPKPPLPLLELPCKQTLITPCFKAPAATASKAYRQARDGPPLPLLIPP